MHKVFTGSWQTHVDGPKKQTEAYLKLKDAIVNLELAPNTVLNENYIMEVYEIGRTPMREALNLLQAEMLISKSQGRGYMVRDIQFQDFIELYELKEGLEGEAAYLACMRKTKASIAKIEEAYDKYKDAVANMTYKDALVADLEFHWAIIDGCGNRHLKHHMSRLNDVTFKFFNMYYTEESLLPSSELLNVAHQDIINAIKGDDCEMARQKMQQHIREVKNVNRTELFHL